MDKYLVQAWADFLGVLPKDVRRYVPATPEEFSDPARETVARIGTETVAETRTEIVAGKVAGKGRRKPSPKPSPHRAVVTALRLADKPLTVTELADIMGVSVGESSKRVKAARDFVKTRRSGRCKFVTLKPLRIAQIEAIFSNNPSTPDRDK